MFEIKADSLESSIGVLELSKLPFRYRQAGSELVFQVSCMLTGPRARHGTSLADLCGWNMSWGMWTSVTMLGKHFGWTVSSVVVDYLS